MHIGYFLLRYSDSVPIVV